MRGRDSDVVHADMRECFKALLAYVEQLDRPLRAGDAFTCRGCGRRFTYEIKPSPVWRAGRPS